MYSPGSKLIPGVKLHKSGTTSSLQIDSQTDFKKSDDNAPEKLDLASKIQMFNSIPVRDKGQTAANQKRGSTPNIGNIRSSIARSQDSTCSTPSTPVTAPAIQQRINQLAGKNGGEFRLSEGRLVSSVAEESTNDETQNSPKRMSADSTLANRSSNSPTAVEPAISPVTSNENQENQRIFVREIRAKMEQTQRISMSQNVPKSVQIGKQTRLSSADLAAIVQSAQNVVTGPPAANTLRYIKQTIDPCSLYENTDSVVDDSNYTSNPTLSRCDSSDSTFSDEEIEYHSERQTKLRRCIEEVHATEKTYVDILYVLAVKMVTSVKKTCEKEEDLFIIFNDTYRRLLGAIQAMYKFHHENILPQIEQFVTGQSTGNMWTVLEKHLQVIEPIYKDYYVKYDETQHKLDELCRTEKLINEAMLECQTLLGNLYPISQLNCPNQRLVRYILCMKTYMKYLDESSEEYTQTMSIHNKLDQIALRCEEELVVSPAQLKEIMDRIDNPTVCIQQHRKLVWHGRLKKQSPRRHMDIVQRYIIVFSNCILVCNEDSAKRLEIKRELSMKDLTLDVVSADRTSLSSIDQLNSLYPFRVNAVEKSYEFLADKESDRERWVRKIKQASDEFNKRYSTFETRKISFSSDAQRQQLGSRAPVWINDIDVTRCQVCNNRFRSTYALRRHHCRCCGRCICGGCSSKRLILTYSQAQGESRVCDTCYTNLTGNSTNRNPGIWSKTTREVDQTILFGDFRPINSNTAVWIALQEDFCLHIYGGKLDQAEDYFIKLSELYDMKFDSESRTFSLQEITKQHKFILDLNHQLNYSKNELTMEKSKNFDNNINFCAQLWLEAMEAARSNSFPKWYTRKRDSSDSGVSNIS